MNDIQPITLPGIDPGAPGNRRPVQRRNRRAGPRHGPLAGSRRHPHLPRRTLEAPHQTRRLRRRRRGGHRLAPARETRNGHVHLDRSGHPRARRHGAERRRRPAVDRRTHGGQPLRHAGDRRRPARNGRPGAGEKPRQPRPRAVDRRHRAHLQRRHPPHRGHPPRVHVDRQEPLPQPPDVGHSHRAAPPSPPACRSSATRATSEASAS